MENWNFCSKIKIARRHNNKKRSYLLVNTVQAKHIPTPPSEALKMYHALGEKIHKAYPNASLVIGFAETATAIAAGAAEAMGEDTIYFHTTREKVDDESECILFCEEHSHAVEQKLYAKDLGKLLDSTDEAVLIDDEISTGKTLFNIISAMREKIPEFKDRRIVVGSVLNRLTKDREAFFNENNIYFESLYHVVCDDSILEKSGEGLIAPEIADGRDKGEFPQNFFRFKFPYTKYPHKISDYRERCDELAEELINRVDFKKYGEVLFLGTEECMFPAVRAASVIEEKCDIRAYCHATTRSPISIGSDMDYPIRSGFAIGSFYEDERVNYIYNIRHYDAAVVISDSICPSAGAVNILDGILKKHGISNVFYCLGE